MVLCNHGLTLTWGLGGSERICLLAFLRLCPTVLRPTWKPALRKFLSPKLPCPAGTLCAQTLSTSLGKSSWGLKISLG